MLFHLKYQALSNLEDEDAHGNSTLLCRKGQLFNIIISYKWLVEIGYAISDLKGLVEIDYSPISD